jgi:DNA polymerase elongation subunit (family B)
MKNRLEGWLLDVYIQRDKAVLWMKTEGGKVVRLTDKYTPSFYLKPKDTLDIMQLAALLETHPNVTHVEKERKYTSLSMERSDVLHVYVDSLLNHRKLLEDFERVDGIEAYYNLDLLHVQRYLFQNGFPPTVKATVTHNESNELVSLSVLDDSLEVKPPPFTTLILKIEVSSEKLSPDVNEDPVSKIEAFDEDLKSARTFGGDEKEVFTTFCEYVRDEDPDFLVCEAETLTYILERARLKGLNLQLGREKVDILRLKRLLPYSHQGRVHVDLQTYTTIGLAGVVERSRFTYAPPGLAARWPAGRTIDSRQCYEALERDILIPTSGSFYRYVKTAKDTIFYDRGGLILSPKVGLHENVAALDFESMFPHLIIKHNLSYETVTPDHIRKDCKGFLPSLTEACLKRRLHFKHSRKRFPDTSREQVWCEQRQTALKGILVCIYGYSGCFANRFSSVSCYEQVNRLARETLVEALNIALEDDFEVIYADSDSLFVKKEGAAEEDFKSLAEKITARTGLPITLDHHFKFLVLLRQEADPNLEAARRYFGKLTNGELYYRGIELRRHDSPAFLKKFETRLMDLLFDAESTEEVWKEGYKNSFDHVIESCDLIRSGEVQIDELVVSKVLRKPVNSYRSLFPHVVAAIQMAQKGKQLDAGENIEFVYVNAEHNNPFRRVASRVLLENGRQYYDRDKYTMLALDVAETVLGVFGFNRKQLGFERKSSYMEEFRLMRSRDVLSELSDFMETKE